VAVKTAEVGACGEQEEMRKRKRKVERIRVVMGRGMGVILTELYENNVSRINEKTSHWVPARIISVIYKQALKFI
jgi:hypothetical protein